MITAEIDNRQLMFVLQSFGAFQLLLIYIVIRMQIGHMFGGWRAWVTIITYTLSVAVMFFAFHTLPAEITIDFVAESGVRLLVMTIAASVLLTVGEFVQSQDFDKMKDEMKRIWNQWQSDGADNSQDITDDENKAEQIPDFHR
jgi:hypothetical protein